MNKKLLIMLNVVVLIAGFTQGMILTVLSVMMQSKGISSSIIGLHATGMYIGILAIAFFVEGLIFKFGYKRNLLFGISLVIISIILIPIFQEMIFWFILRVIIGLGVILLQISGQSWMTDITPKKNRGFIISIFGACFGAGFAIGPLMINVLQYNEFLPFIISTILYSVAFIGISFFKNKYPNESISNGVSQRSSERFIKALKYSWVAFLCPLLYGVLEATLNGVFPAYGMQIGYSPKIVSLLISSFAIGSILFQVPIGKLSDIIGRYQILLILVTLGSICFLGLIFFEENIYFMFGLLTLAGVFVGTLYSLGVSFMADLLPNSLLPAGNIICSVFYSVGSIGGPLISGGLMDISKSISIFIVFLIALLILLASLIIHRNIQYQSTI